MARTPKSSSVPALAADESMRAIFATDIVSAGFIGGWISINLATHRCSMPEPGKDPEVHRALVARLVLSREAAMQLAQTLANLARTGKQPAGKDDGAAAEKSNE